MDHSKKKCTLILLAGGRGKRMGSEIPKQFIEINGKPILWYSLEAAEQSSIIDECVIVIQPEDKEYVLEDIVNKYSFAKKLRFANAGCERYESVWSGLVALAGYDWAGMSEQERIDYLKKSELMNSLNTDIIFIHDGARPFVDEEIFGRCYEGAVKYGACVAAVRSKDTVKIVDEEGKIINTPNRNTVWNMQTPQTFEASLIYDAYRRVMSTDRVSITDDAQAVELAGGREVHVVEGAYTNIKVTTPDDLALADTFLCNRQ